MGELRLVDLALMVAPWLTSIKATEDQRMAAPLILTHMIGIGERSRHVRHPVELLRRKSKRV